jgi:hypothetical protein
MVTRNARCTREIKYRIVILKAAFNRKKTLFISKLELHLRKKLVKCYIWGIKVYRAKTWKDNQKHLGSSEMWSWRRMEKISWTDQVKNEEVLHRVKMAKNIIHTVERRKADWIGHILRRNCLLKHIIGGKIEGKIEGGIEIT